MNEPSASLVTGACGLAALIEEQEAWITEKEESGSDRDRRVLPARRGQVAKDRERLSGLSIEHELELRTSAAAVLARPRQYSHQEW